MKLGSIGKGYPLKALIILAIALVIFVVFLRESHPKIVAGFPDIPAYPDAVLISSTEITDPTVKDVGKRYVTTWESRQSVPALSLWFREKITQKGWMLTIPPGDETMDIQQIDFEKANTTLTLSLVRQGNKTEITINYRPGEVIEDEEGE